MIPLLENKYYHIFNRGINSKDLFSHSDEFKFFLQKYFYYTYPVASTYSYCLMKNHFHVLIKIRSKEEQEKIFLKYKVKTQNKTIRSRFHGFQNDSFKSMNPSKQLSHLFNCYTRNYNMWNNRTGKLFEQPFKRKLIENEDYLRYLVCYIHCNPIHHNIENDYQSYPYSSYPHLILNESGMLDNSFIDSWFGGVKNFRIAHNDINIFLSTKLRFD